MLRRVACFGSCSLVVGLNRIQDDTILLQADVRKVERFAGEAFNFRRDVPFLEPGARAELQVSKGCKVQNEHGAGECDLAWSSKNDIVYKVHLEDGIRPGDNLTFTLQTDLLSKNDYEAGLADMFSGETIKVAGSCQMCEGSCSVSGSKTSFFSMDATFPTVWDDKTLCSSLGKTSDMVLVNMSAIPVGPFGNDAHILYLQLSGTAQTSVGISSKDGSKRVEDRYYFTYPEPAASPRSLLQLAEAEAHGTRSESGSQSVSLLGAARLGVKQVVSNMFHAIAAPKNNKNKNQNGNKPAKSAAAPTKDAGSKSVVATKKGAGSKSSASKKLEPPPSTGHLAGIWARLKVWYMEDKTNKISIRAKDACTETDSLGSVDCRFYWNRPVDLAVDLNLNGKLEPFAAVDLKIEPKIDGPMKVLAGSFLHPVKMPMALCGNSTWHYLYGQKVQAVPPRCGSYSLNLAAPSYYFKVPDFSDIPLPWPKELASFPLLPKKVDMLPALGLAVTATVKHPDGSPMLSFTVDLGLE